MQQPHVAVPVVGPPPSPPPPFPHSPTAQQASPAATAPLPSRVAEAPFTVADKDDGGVIGAAHWFFSTLFSLGDGGKGMATSGDKALALATLVILVMLAYGCWRALPVRRGSYDAVAARRSPSGAQLFGSDQGRAAARAGLLDEEDEEDSHEQHAKMNEEKRLNERVAARVEEALAHARRTAAEQGHDQRQQHVAQQKGLAPIGTHMDLDAEEIYGGQLIHEGEENVMDEYPADLDNDEEIEPDDSISVAWFKTARNTQNGLAAESGDVRAQASSVPPTPVTVEAPDGSRHAMDVELKGLRSSRELRRGMLQGYQELLGVELPSHALQVHARLANGSSILLTDHTPLSQSVLRAVSFYVWADKAHVRSTQN